MGVLVAIIGVLWVVWGFATLGAAKSAMHEIYAAVLIGSGSVTFALGVLIHKLGGVIFVGQRMAARARAQDAEAAREEKAATIAPASPSPQSFASRHR